MTRNPATGTNQHRVSSRRHVQHRSQQNPLKKKTCTTFRVIKTGLNHDSCSLFLIFQPSCAEHVLKVENIHENSISSVIGVKAASFSSDRTYHRSDSNEQPNSPSLVRVTCGRTHRFIICPRVICHLRRIHPIRRVGPVVESASRRAAFVWQRIISELYESSQVLQIGLKICCNKP